MKAETSAEIGIAVLSQDKVLLSATLDRYLADHPRGEVTILGNPDILANQLLALFCSVRCPGDLILQTYDLARSLRDKGRTVWLPFADGKGMPEVAVTRYAARGRLPVPEAERDANAQLLV